MQSNEKDEEELWLAKMEGEYMAAMAAEPDYESQLVADREASLTKIYGGFQDSATSIAQLYKERLNTNDTGSLWTPFQAAAGSVTGLYKEASDSLKRTNEKAISCGYQRRTREMSEWVRKKNRRYIRREELLAYLAGKPPPPLHAPKTTASPHRNHHPHHHPHQTVHHHHSPAALLHHGGRHNYHHHHHNHHRRSSTESLDMHMPVSRRQRTPEVYTYMSDELSRHKRSGSPLDISMDLPSLVKRPRYS